MLASFVANGIIDLMLAGREMRNLEEGEAGVGDEGESLLGNHEGAEEARRRSRRRSSGERMLGQEERNRIDDS